MWDKRKTCYSPRATMKFNFTGSSSQQHRKVVFQNKHIKTKYNLISFLVFLSKQRLTGVVPRFHDCFDCQVFLTDLISGGRLFQDDKIEQSDLDGSKEYPITIQ